VLLRHQRAAVLQEANVEPLPQNPLFVSDLIRKIWFQSSSINRWTNRTALHSRARFLICKRIDVITWDTKRVLEHLIHELKDDVKLDDPLSLSIYFILLFTKLTRLLMAYFTACSSTYCHALIHCSHAYSLFTRVLFILYAFTYCLCLLTVYAYLLFTLSLTVYAFIYCCSFCLVSTRILTVNAYTHCLRVNSQFTLTFDDHTLTYSLRFHSQFMFSVYAFIYCLSLCPCQLLFTLSLTVYSVA
jgi:hypothetical protein